MEDASRGPKSHVNQRRWANIQANHLFRLGRIEQNHGNLWREEVTEEGQKGVEIRRSRHIERFRLPSQTFVSYA